MRLHNFDVLIEACEINDQGGARQPFFGYRTSELLEIGFYGPAFFRRTGQRQQTKRCDAAGPKDD